MGDKPKEEEGEGPRSYLLEVRTNFILKPIRAEEEIVMDTESFCERVMLDYEAPKFLGALVTRAYSGKNLVDGYIRGRLSKYCMPDGQIRALAQTIFDFFQRLANDPRYDSFHTITVVLGIDVCTVQLEGEPLDVTMDRSLKPDFMIPLQLGWTLNSQKSYLRKYLTRLPIVRVTEEEEEGAEKEGWFLARIESCPLCLELVSVSLQIRSHAENYALHQRHSVSRKEGRGLMEVCPICLREPIVGAKIAPLPCKHAFHDHCLARWLMKSKSCPLCRVC